MAEWSVTFIQPSLVQISDMIVPSSTIAYVLTYRVNWLTFKSNQRIQLAIIVTFELKLICVNTSLRLLYPPLPELLSLMDQKYTVACGKYLHLNCYIIPTILNAFECLF